MYELKCVKEELNSAIASKKAAEAERNASTQIAKDTMSVNEKLVVELGKLKKHKSKHKSKQSNSILNVV